MHQRICLIFLALCGPVVASPQPEQPKMVTGMSIVGNNEAPKSLYIVPWKSSETGADSGLSSEHLNEKLVPVDRDVFRRELDFYELSNAK
jgi:hypothetical protein